MYGSQETFECTFHIFLATEGFLTLLKGKMLQDVGVAMCSILSR